jgi:hypothetical protein
LIAQVTLVRDDLLDGNELEYNDMNDEDEVDDDDDDDFLHGQQVPTSARSASVPLIYFQVISAETTIPIPPVGQVAPSKLIPSKSPSSNIVDKKEKNRYFFIHPLHTTLIQDGGAVQSRVPYGLECYLANRHAPPFDVVEDEDTSTTMIDVATTSSTNTSLDNKPASVGSSGNPPPGQQRQMSSFLASFLAEDPTLPSANQSTSTSSGGSTTITPLPVSHGLPRWALPPAGLEIEFRSLVSMVSPCIQPQIMAPLTCTILVTGPRRSGKRVLIARVAHVLGMHLIERNMFDIIGDNERHTVKKLQALFDEATLCAPVVLHLRRLVAIKGTYSLFLLFLLQANMRSNFWVDYPSH